jgi:hypothetical protein
MFVFPLDDKMNGNVSFFYEKIEKFAQNHKVIYYFGIPLIEMVIIWIVVLVLLYFSTPPNVRFGALDNPPFLFVMVVLFYIGLIGFQIKFLPSNWKSRKIRKN